jgi:hypothetical protein
MIIHCLAGQRLLLSSSGLGLDCFVENEGLSMNAVDPIQISFPERKDLRFIVKTLGWVGGVQRLVEVYDAPRGMLLRVEESDEFFIASFGGTISKQNLREDLTKLDREIILGPALVLALALRDIWCLHASAALYRDTIIVFVGESGQGKSTLAAYLSTIADWRLVADDILPVRANADGVNVLPHFPQLKLPLEAQPGVGLRESLPLGKICVLTPARSDSMPGLRKLPPGLAVHMLLRHTAGTRMFSPEILGNHLAFCSLAARQVPVYQLAYPHRKDVLPGIKELLENLR